tara:strand:+ start:225 stop:356 length:132 start_codon:yes stop_codon:yes gene_type:complete
MDQEQADRISKEEDAQIRQKFIDMVGFDPFEPSEGVSGETTTE